MGRFVAAARPAPTLPRRDVADWLTRDAEADWAAFLDSLDAEERGVAEKLVKYALNVYGLRPADVEQLAIAIGKGRLQGLYAAYADIAESLGAAAGRDAYVAPDAVLDLLEAGARAVAAGMADTYHDDLARATWDYLRDYYADQETLDGAAAGMDGVLQPWAADRLRWKAPQVATHETGVGATAGTDQAVADLQDGIFDLGGDLGAVGLDDIAGPGAIVVAVLPDDAKEPVCADYAGNYYPIDDYDDIPEWPLHPGCPHESVILVEAAGEISTDLGDDAAAFWGATPEEDA